MPRAGLGGVDRRIRHQLDVGPGDLLRLGVEDDRAVHLRHLVEQARRVIDVEAEPAGEEERDLLGLTDHDQATGRGVDDVVNPLAEGGPGRDHVERPQEPWILVHQRSRSVIPGGQCHQQ